MSNYLIYPCKTMRITQNYNGTTSHLPHSTGNPKDYPWDEGCKDSGRGYMYCPCDEVVVRKIYGVGARGTNTLWIESTSKVDFADGSRDFFSMIIIHPNDDDLKKIKVGKKFKRGEKICREGVDGATGNHFHFAAGKGKISGSGWTQNNKGKWVLTTTNGNFKPEKLFFVDEGFTKIVSSKGIVFKYLPKEIKNKILPERGYFKKGDKGEEVKKIIDFCCDNLVRGNLFGDYTEALVKEFQRKNGLTVDGRIGLLTLSKLEELGFKY